MSQWGLPVRPRSADRKKVRPTGRYGSVSCDSRRLSSRTWIQYLTGHHDHAHANYGWRMADRQCPFAPVPAVSGSITDQIGSGIPTFQPFPLFLNITRCRPCIHSLFTFRGSIPSLSPRSGILLCPDLPWRTNTWYKGRVGEDSDVSRTYPAPSSSFRVALGVGLFWKKEAALLGTTQSLSSFPNEWLGSMLGCQLSSPHLGSILAPTLLTTGLHRLHRPLRQTKRYFSFHPDPEFPSRRITLPQRYDMDPNLRTK
jgi:hypothetical protein